MSIFDITATAARNPASVEALRFPGAKLPLVAIYGDETGEDNSPNEGLPFYLARELEDPREIREVPEDHRYFQLYFRIASHTRNGKPEPTDVAIELDGRNGDPESFYVSAWDAERQEGIELGNVPIDHNRPIGEQLEAYLKDHEVFQQRFPALFEPPARGEEPDQLRQR